MSQIEIIEKLSHTDLRDLLKNLLGRFGFQNIEEIDVYISATEKSVLSTINRAFILPTCPLSGNVDMNQIKELIEGIRRKGFYHIITIVSNRHISEGFKENLNGIYSECNFDYIGRDNLIAIINEKFPDYWRHDDTALIEYERQYKEVIESENQLKLLHLPTEKYKKLLSIYIQPSLIQEEEDPQTHRFTRRRIDMKDLINGKGNAVISGLPGSGKSTLLYNIGLILSQENGSIRNVVKKNLPVFVTAMDLIAKQKEVKDVILEKTKELGTNLDELCENYNVVILVDSIDEFEQKQQEYVIRKLCNLNKKGARFILTTRREDKFQEFLEKRVTSFYEISRFNTTQIRRFVNAFLPNEEKANDLLDSLRENKILERLPITPLTISLISILFDETDYEVPATITDIYSKFNDLVIGRTVVSNKIEFIDISFRERILSMYGFFLMKRQDHRPLTYNEFIDYFVDFYSGKSKQIKGASLEEGLEYIVKNTGILYLKDGKYVCFSHDTYMEYYAALEFFKFHRKEEDELVNNFFDLTWQNVAGFYAGMTKDMDDFAKNVNKKLNKASKVSEYISGIQGAGYLLQALYQSDDTIRRDVILTALNLSLETNEVFKKMTTLPNTLFKNYSIPIVQALSLLHFYEMFNSLTLKTPLELSYELLRAKYESVASQISHATYIIPSIGYQLLCLAFTLNSKRIDNEEPLLYVLDQRPLMSDININSLMGIGLEVLGNKNYHELRDAVRKDFKSLEEIKQRLITDASQKVRFSVLDTIHPLKNVKIFVEGRTDALILEHAFMTLTDGRTPYWNVEMATQNGLTGSTHAVSKAIDSGINYSETYERIIGIFDHDKAGLCAYRSLDKDYEEIEKDCIKLNKIKKNIYLLCLPVPGEMKQYLHNKQDFNFFEIEHYFGHDYLKEKGMIKEQVLEGIYEIVDSKKVTFATEIMSETNPYIFRFFVDLFKKIDQITGINVDYDDSDVVVC